MLSTIAITVAVIISCLVVQSVMVALCLFCFVRLISRKEAPGQAVLNFVVLALVMLLLLIGHLVQITLWGTALVWLGAFNDFGTALYFSGASFTSIGYGDVVLEPQWDLLGPLEGITGLLMVGVSTAVMATAIMNMLKRWFARAITQARANQSKTSSSVTEH